MQPPPPPGGAPPHRPVLKEGVFLARTGTALATRLRLLTTASDQARGLMFTRKREGFCLIIIFDPPRRDILHMWFVFYPIDVVCCDREHRVISLKSHLLPFCIYPIPASAYVLEFPEGTIRSHGVRIGDRLTWNPPAQTI